MPFLRHRNIAKTLVLLLLCLHFSGCMKWDYNEPEDFNASGAGLFIVNEGNFQYGNASLSYYVPETGTATWRSRCASTITKDGWW